MVPQAARAGTAPAEQFLARLAEQGRLTAVAAERVSRVQLETLDRLASVLLKLGILGEEELAAELAQFCALERWSPDEAIVPALPTVDDVSIPFLRAHEIVPIREVDNV